MLPVVSGTTSYIPIQATLVSTPIPDSSTSYVAPNSVSPSVSNAQVNNNASNNNIIVATSGEDAAAAAAQADFASSASAVNASANLSANAQSTFLAQLISQEVPPALQQGLQGLLAQYEKLVAFSYVKYKPSDAGVPQSSPASVFGSILEQEKAAPIATPVVVTPPVQPQAAVEATPVVPAPVQQTPTVSTNEPQASNDNTPAPANNNASNTIVLTSPLPLPQATQAYVATAARNNAPAAAALQNLA